jgi:hypothetical protein
MDDSIKFAIFLSIVFVLLIIGLTDSYQKAFGELEVLSYTVICQTTNIEPYYDCPEEIDGYFDASGEAWLVITVNSTIFQDMDGASVYGFAVHTMNPVMPKGKYNACDFLPSVNATYMGMETCDMNYTVVGINTPTTCYTPYPCMTVLEHELKHLKCMCNWHEGLYGKTPPIIINGPL